VLELWAGMQHNAVTDSGFIMDKGLRVLLLVGLVGPGFRLCAAVEIDREKPAFLQQNGDLAESTSLGLIAEGLETLNQNLQSSISALNTQQTSFASQQQATNLALLSLQAEQVRDQIEDDQFQIQSLQRQIDGLEVEIEAADLGCPANADCRSCAQDASCVWCVATQSCVSGGEQGADDGECADFEYRMCQSAVCESITNCRDCLERTDCGWCLSGADCVLAVQADSLCDPAYYFQASLSGDFNTCPSRTDGNSQDTSQGDYRVREVQVFEDRIAALQTEIGRLSGEQDTLNRLISTETAVEPVVAFGSLEGLGERVDQRAQEERDSNTVITAVPVPEIEPIAQAAEQPAEVLPESPTPAEESPLPAEEVPVEQSPPMTEEPSTEAVLQPIDQSSEEELPATTSEELVISSETEEETAIGQAEEPLAAEQPSEAEPSSTAEVPLAAEGPASIAEETGTSESSEPVESEVPVPEAETQSPELLAALASIQASGDLAAQASESASAAADQAELAANTTQSISEDLSDTLDSLQPPAVEETASPEEPPPAALNPNLAAAVEGVRASAEVASRASDVAQQAAETAEGWSSLAQNYSQDLDFTLTALSDSPRSQSLSFLQALDSADQDEAIPLNSTADSLPSTAVAPLDLVTDATSFLQVVFAWLSP